MAGFAPMVLGLFVWWIGASYRPDILVEGQGRLIAVRNGAGVLVVNSAMAARHAAGEWAKQEGLIERLVTARDDPMAACDAQGCMFTAGNGETVAFVRNATALEEDCARASIVIASVAAYRCEGPRLAIDARDLYFGGGHAIWFEEDGVRMETVAQRRGQRPWVSARE